MNKSYKIKKTAFIRNTINFKIKNGINFHFINSGKSDIMFRLKKREQIDEK